MAQSQQLKIAQILPALESGGVERGTLEVARELAKQGHRSYVISTGGRLVEQLQRDGSTHVSMSVKNKSPLTLLTVPRLRRWLLENPVDILHARSRLPAWIAWLALHGLPANKRPHFITTCHGAHSVNRYSAIMARGEKVIAVSEFIREYLIDNYGLAQEAITLIPRGVDSQEFPFGYRPTDDWMDAWQNTYPQLKDVPVLTLAGRLTRLKGHEAFIRLIASLNQSGNKVYGLIVGGEDPKRLAYAREIRELAASLAGENIIFTGMRTDIRDIYAVSDIVYSLSSKPESFGRTVLEAIKLGRPVIGYDHGGVSEILRATFPQGLVAPQDAECLLKNTREILHEKPVLGPTTQFDLHDTLERTVRLYKEICSYLNDR